MTQLPVMAGPDQAIYPSVIVHGMWRPDKRCVDGRVRPGHDEERQG